MKKKLERLKALLIEYDKLWMKMSDLHDEIRNYEETPDLVDAWLSGINEDSFVEWAMSELNKQKNDEKKLTKIQKLEKQLAELRQS